MRKINTGDIFKAARLIKVANLKDRIIEIYKEKQDKDIEAVGLDIIFTLIESCSNKEVENIFYEFLSGILETEINSLKEMELKNLINNLQRIAKDNDLTYFFKLATQSI